MENSLFAGKGIVLVGHDQRNMTALYRNLTNYQYFVVPQSRHWPRPVRYLTEQEVSKVYRDFRPLEAA